MVQTLSEDNWRQLGSNYFQPQLDLEQNNNSEDDVIASPHVSQFINNSNKF